MIPVDDTASLGLLFHLNSEPRTTSWPVAESAGRWAPVPADEPVAEVALPRDREETQLARLIWARRSCRSFVNRPMPLADLATMLLATYGAHPSARLPGSPKAH